MKKEHILISEFMNREFQAYKDNASFNRTFHTFKECEDWITELKNSKNNSDGYYEGYVPCLGWKDFGEGYETNWNLLMEVVDKIESLGFSITIKDNLCYILSEINRKNIDPKMWGLINTYNTTTLRCNTKKEAVFNSVLQFIDDYNEFINKPN